MRGLKRLIKALESALSNPDIRDLPDQVLKFLIKKVYALLFPVKDSAGLSVFAKMPVVRSIHCYFIFNRVLTMKPLLEDTA